MHLDHDIFVIPWRTLVRNKMRSFLTSLGIIIGIASVIMIMSIGAGASSLVFNQIKGIGSNLIGILPGAALDSGQPSATLGVNVTTLTADDIKAVQKQLPEIEAATAYIRGVANIAWQNRSTDSSFVGVTANYIQVEEAKVISGRFLTTEEEEEVVRVAILGSQVKEDLFGNQDPLNEKIKVNKETFTVIGVMEPRGSAGFQNQDDQIFISLTTAQKLMLGVNHISFARAKIAEGTNIDVALDEVKKILRERHDINSTEEDDFTAESADKALDTLKNITNALNYFLAAVAAVSLLVGGIGVMNIMLVAVTERTREIGLRKAVGAKSADISQQFLAETFILSAAGGFIGIAFGVLISLLVSLAANGLGYDWDFVVPPFSVFLAVVFTFLVAIVFGWYPAKKAAKLKPIEALRYE